MPVCLQSSTCQYRFVEVSALLEKLLNVQGCRQARKAGEGDRGLPKCCPNLSVITADLFASSELLGTAAAWASGNFHSQLVGCQAAAASFSQTQTCGLRKGGLEPARAGHHCSDWIWAHRPRVCRRHQRATCCCEGVQSGHHHLEINLAGPLVCMLKMMVAQNVRGSASTRPAII